MSAGRRGIVLKLLPVTLVLLAVPWLAGRYFERFAEFVLAGQRTSLPLAAQAVASVLAEREDLFRVAAGRPLLVEECGPRELPGALRLDGLDDDWGGAASQRCGYGRADVVAPAAGAADAALDFDLSLARQGGDLLLFAHVKDADVRYRRSRDRALDGSDQLRLVVPDATGGERRWVVSATRAGPTTTWEADPEWRSAQGGGIPVRLRGYWRETPDGWSVELRIPGEKVAGGALGIAVADVDDGAGAHVVGAVPASEALRMRDALLAASETAGILRGDDLPGAAVTVVDAGGHVRARGGDGAAVLAPEDRARLLHAALDAPPDAGAVVESAPHARAAAVSQPIRAGDRVIGAVLVEQPAQPVLAGEPDAFEQARIVVTAACAAIAAVLLAFAWRLAWRIRRLRDAAAGAIDPDGRVLQSELMAGRDAGDEIGDLSRTVSGLLGRLDHYTAFLEQMPRTLRHEISNPLNGLATSLENLVAEHPELADSKYVQSAERGVARIHEIVVALTDAASLEQALADDDREPLDLASLVARYVENFAAGCPARRFRLRGADRPAVVRASAHRMEQLLDKLFDNAVAFSPPHAEIEVEVERAQGRVRLAVTNPGPPLPAELGDRIFDSLVTSHPGGGERPHLGIGLYVVRVIAEHLGGRATAESIADPSGTRVTVLLPALP